MSYSRKLETSGALSLVSNDGQINLNADTHVYANELQLGVPLAFAQGGLGSACADAGEARTALGLAIGSDIQAYSASLSDIAGLEPSTDQYLKWNGSNFVASALPSGTDYNADEITLQEAEGQTFSIKDGGVGSTQLADGSVVSSKLGENCVGSSHIDPSALGSGLTGGDGDAVAVDSTVVRTSGNQTLAGVKTFSSPSVFQNAKTLQVSSQSGYCVETRFESQSTNNTQFSLTTMSMDVDAVSHLEAFVSVCSDDMAECASFKLHGVAKNANGTSSSLALNDEVIFRSDANIACVLDVDNGIDVFRIRCTGLASKNLRWSAQIKYNVCPKYSA